MVKSLSQLAAFTLAVKKMMVNKQWDLLRKKVAGPLLTLRIIWPPSAYVRELGKQVSGTYLTSGSFARSH